MDRKIITVLIVAVIAIAAVAVAFIATDRNNGNDGPAPLGETVIDCMGREVPVPGDLDDGIVTVGWNILKVLSFFDAHEHVTCVDMMETMTGMGSMQPHFYSYDMSKVSVHTDSTMGGFTEADVEKIANGHPSLVIMTSNIYNSYKMSCDNLAKVCSLVVVDLSAMSGNFWEEKDGKLVVEAKIQESLHILGDVLGEKDRDEHIIDTLNRTLDDIVAHRATGETPKVNLSGSQMAMGSGDLNLVFPFYNVLDIAGIENAAKDYPVPPWYAELTVEKFTTGYDFDVILYDPSAPQTLSNPNDQAILKWLYGLQGTPDEKEIRIVLTTALCGYDMMNVIADAYYVEATVAKTLTMEQMKTTMVDLYKDLFGDSAGSTVWDGLCDAVDGWIAPSGAHVKLWEQAKVGQVDGKYTFVSA